MNILSQFEEYKINTNLHDSGDFLVLFTEDYTEEEYNLILKGFPEPERLKQNLTLVLNNDHPQIGTKENLVNLVKPYLNDLAKICDEAGEFKLELILNKQNIKQVSSDELFSIREQSDSHFALQNILSDFYHDDLSTNEDSIYGLLEALYGVSYDYELAYFIGAPLLKSKESLFKHYYAFWLKGGLYAIAEDFIYISRIE